MEGIVSELLEQIDTTVEFITKKEKNVRLPRR